MRQAQVPVENVAEILWGVVVVVYLLTSGNPYFLRWPAAVVFALCAVAALVDLYLRKIDWRYLLAYDSLVWSVLLSGMVAVTGGRGSELWPAYLMMSLTAPSAPSRRVPYLLLGLNSLFYALIYLLHNPLGTPLNLGLLALRVGLFLLVAYVVDRSMSRERAANREAVRLAQGRVGELVQARDAERRRVAGDIHDWLGTGIIAPMRKLELALRTDDLSLVRQRVEEAAEGLRRSHTELRRLMENLHPHLLEQMGLTEALRAYLQEWGDEVGVATELVKEPGPEPGAEVALALFRIQQEALNNVAKHAQARRVTVRLILHPTDIRLLISDDGVGVAGGRPGGRGLTGMRERAALFGGTLTITTAPNQGTTIAAHLPVAP